MEFLASFIKDSAEFKRLGLNYETFFALATMIFTILQALGAWSQWKKIRRERTTVSVSEPFFAFATCYFFAFLLYGLCQNKLSIIFNGLILGPINALVLSEFFKYKKFSKKEIFVTVASPLAIPAMIIFKDSGKEILLGALLAGLIFFGIAMFFQMKISGKRGAISLNFLIITLATNTFWLFYSITIANPQLIGANAVSMLTFSSMIFTYWKYGQEKKEA